MALFGIAAVAVGIVSTHALTIKRPNATTYSTGGFANAQTFTTTATGSGAVQPASGKALQRLPEGMRESEIVSIHTTLELQNKDRVEITGKGTYQVEHVFDQTAAGAYYKALARKLDSNEPRV